MKTVSVKTNLITGALFMLLAIVTWIVIPYQIPIPENGTVITDPSFFPRVFTACLFVVGLVLFVLTLVSKKENIVKVDIGEQLGMLLYLGMIILFVVLMQFAGFLVSSVIFGVGSLLYFHCRNKWYYIIVVAAAVLVFLGFRFLLNVNLP